MTRRPLPAGFDLGPFTYTVLVDEVAIAKVSKRQGLDLFGNCDGDMLTVTIDPGVAPGMLRETLLHEALHAVTAMSGVAYEQGEEGEERLVRRLSPLLLELLRRNPAFVAFLTAV